MDLDVTNGIADVINGTGTSSGTVTLSDLKLLNDTTAIDKTFKVQMTQGGLGLALSSAVAEQLDSKEYSLGQEDEPRYYDTIQANTAWNRTYNSHVDTMNVFGKLGLATTTTTNDSIGVSESRRVLDHTTDTSMGDTLKLVNNDTTNSTKNFTAAADGATYLVTDNLIQKI